MAHRVAVKTTFEVEKVIDPIYSGGSVALSEDGRTLATALGDDVILTDLETGRRLARVEGDGEAVTTLALTPQASHLIACSRSLSMRVFGLERTAEGTLTTTVLRTLKPHPGPVITIATDHTGSLLATGGADGIVKVWDIRGGYTTHTFHGHSGLVSALCFFEVDPASDTHAIQRSDSKKRKRQQNTDSPANGDVDGGYRLASASEDGQVRVWNLHKRKCIATLESHVSLVRSLDYDRQSNVLLSASRDKTVILWSASTWKIRNTIPIMESVEAAGFMEGGTFIYTGGEDGTLRIWNAQNGQEMTREQAPQSEEKSIVQIVYFEALPFVLTIHTDQTLLLHSVAVLSEQAAAQIEPLPVIRQISGTHDDVIDLAFVGRDRSLLAVATNLEDLRLLSINGNEQGLAGDADSNENRMSNYFGADVALLKGHKDIIICLDVDWSGHWIATGAKDNSARMWRVDAESSSFECRGIFTGHAESLGAVSLPHETPQPGSSAYTDPLSNPPAFLITGSQDKTIKRWETSSIDKTSLKASRATYTRKAHDKDINALDVHESSTLFASASQDRTVKIWSLEDGETVGILRGHKRGVWSAKFSPKSTPSITMNENGNSTSGAKGLILTSSGDKTVKIWSLADYSCIRTFEGHTNSVLKVLWLPVQRQEQNGNHEAKRGPLVASAGSDGLVKLWDVQSGELACTLDNHTDRVWALASDSGTGSLVSGGGDSVITFWKDTTETTAMTASKAATERVEQDQALQNYIRAGRFREAIVLALHLNHPARLLALFKDVCAKWPRDEGSLIGDKGVDQALQTLSDDQLIALLGRVRDWNTNAKTASIAQRVFWTLIKIYPPSRFVEIGERTKHTKKDAGMKDILDAMKAYTERHYRRMDELINQSFLVKYTLGQIDEVV